MIAPGAGTAAQRLACMLWEDEFYEDGVTIAGRIGARPAGRA